MRNWQQKLYLIFKPISLFCTLSFGSIFLLVFSTSTTIEIVTTRTDGIVISANLTRGSCWCRRNGVTSSTIDYKRANTKCDNVARMCFLYGSFGHWLQRIDHQRKEKTTSTTYANDIGNLRWKENMCTSSNQQQRFIFIRVSFNSCWLFRTDKSDISYWNDVLFRPKADDCWTRVYSERTVVIVHYQLPHQQHQHEHWYRWWYRE